MRLLKKFLFIPVLLVCSIAYSAPVISTFDDVTISGSLFGNAPDIVFFDNFENGALNDDISTSNPIYGTYAEVSSTNPPYYTDSVSVSGDKAMQGELTISSTYAQIAMGTDVAFFVDYHAMLPEGTNAPYGDDSLGMNWKMLWVLGADTGDDDQTLPTVLGNLPDKTDEQYFNYYVTRNDPDPGYSKDFTSSCNLTMDYGVWLHWAAYMKAGFSNDGAFSFWEVWDGGVNQMIDDEGVNTLKEGGEWEKININGYGRKTTNCYPTFDDVYIAIGANCQARLVVGNNETYSNSNVTAIQVADENNWTAGAIRIYAFNQGAHENNTQLYLFVIDANGDVSNGLPVYFENNILYAGSPSIEIENNINGNGSISGNGAING